MTDRDSLDDLFENTQASAAQDLEKEPEKWKGYDLEYPWLIIFSWGEEMNPFILLTLIEIDPSGIDSQWLSGLLSPASRCKHRNLKMFPDTAVSIFAKIQKSNIYTFL